MYIILLAIVAIAFFNLGALSMLIYDAIQAANEDEQKERGE